MTLHTGTTDAATLDELAREVLRAGLAWAREKTKAGASNRYVADDEPLKGALEKYREEAEAQVLRSPQKENE